jgi:hypothetical protein
VNPTILFKKHVLRSGSRIKAAKATTEDASDPNIKRRSQNILTPLSISPTQTFTPIIWRSSIVP